MLVRRRYGGLGLLPIYDLTNATQGREWLAKVIGSDARGKRASGAVWAVKPAGGGASEGITVRVRVRVCVVGADSAV